MVQAHMNIDVGETSEADEVEAARPWCTMHPRADRSQHLRIVEAMLFAAEAPVAIEKLQGFFPEGTDVAALLADLQANYANRGVNLVQIAGNWTLRTADDLSFLLRRETVEQKRLSKAALETLAIVAYHQPVTRAEIEEIRGVAISKGTLDILHGNRLGQNARPPPHAGPAGDLRHDRIRSSATSASMNSAIFRACRN